MKTIRKRYKDKIFTSYAIYDKKGTRYIVLKISNRNKL
jgi:hypothetical protein